MVVKENPDRKKRHQAQDCRSFSGNFQGEEIFESKLLAIHRESTYTKLLPGQPLRELACSPNN